MKHASKLPDDYEYAIVCWGQSNMRPWGQRSEGYLEAPHLRLDTSGAILTIAPGLHKGTPYVGVLSGYYDELFPITISKAWVDADLRLGTVLDPKIGNAVVTDVTVAGSAKTVTAVDTGTDTITIANHGFSDGYPLQLDGGIGGLTDGDVFYVKNATTNTFQVTTTADPAAVAVALSSFTTAEFTAIARFTVVWDSDITGAIDAATESAWVTHEENKWKAYKSVRMLTPWLPDTKGSYPNGTPVLPPGFTVPEGITSYEDLGAWLDFTFIEGITGPGIWEDAGAMDPSPNANEVELSGAPTDAELYLNCYVRARVYDADDVLIAICTGRTKSVSGAVYTLEANWTGGQPSAVPGASTYKLDIWMPHYLNNPHLETLGYNFSQPSNDPQPFGHVLAGQAYLHNVPAGRSSTLATADRYYGYSSSLFAGAGRFGMVLPFAWRLAQALGKRINIIHLGVNSAGIFEQAGVNVFGNPYEVGWWDPDKHLDWTPSRTDGSAARLKKLIQTIAPGATAIEGGKPLRILGVLGAQGEAETLQEKTQDNYKRALPAFYRWLTEVISEATDANGKSLSYYKDVGKMPVCHLRLPADPWELDAATVAALYGMNSVDGDSDGIVNAAIRDTMAKREFGVSLDTEGSPKMNNVLGVDPLHFNGVGEAINGANAADLLAQQIDEAVAGELMLSDPTAIDICNTALSYIGEDSGDSKITSLDPAVDASTNAERCARFYPKALQQLLERCTWSFATRREPLVELVSDDIRKIEWPYAYAMPNNVAKVFAVLPPGAADDYSVGVLPASSISQDLPPALNTGIYAPAEFTVETDLDGNEIIYAKIDDAVARFNTTVADPAHMSGQFRNALAWKTAAMLAGVTLKGAEGQELVLRCERMAEAYLNAAKELDGGNRQVHPTHTPPWMSR